MTQRSVSSRELFMNFSFTARRCVSWQHTPQVRSAVPPATSSIEMPAVPLEAVISATTSEARGGPRQHLIEVSFPDAPVAVEYISFCNYYSSAISVSHTSSRADADAAAPRAHGVANGQGQSSKPPPPTWQVVTPKLTLMADPHCEDDAQRYHELSCSHFAKGFDHQHVTRLRICCIQPSPCWREYGLRHLRFYTLEQRVSSSLKPPPPLTDQQRKLAAAIMEEVSPVLRSELSALAAPPRGVVTAHLIEHPQAPTCVPPPHGGGRDTRSSSRVLQLTSLAQTASLLRETAASTHGRPPTMRRRGDSSALSLAPYLVGEWSDELRLTSECCCLLALCFPLPRRPQHQ